MEDHLLRNLKRVVDETGAKIVLSSDWRRHPQARAEAQRVLNTAGMQFIAYTPCMSPYLAQRPTEIMSWKRDNNKAGGEKVTQWVAIDDRELTEERHGNYLRGQFVQTHPLRGLTSEAADECIRILNQDPPLAATVGGDPSFGGHPPRSASASAGQRGLDDGSGPFERPRGSVAAAAAASAASATAAARALQAKAATSPAGAVGRAIRGRSVGATMGQRRGSHGPN
eukprot:TRINITY_DN10882_c0_g2_i1.p1 TRINITY_DN10882_c0_g2~~TRINITY_DN10882_c0_g2_i1.p1  ORF type:complete len:226 (+),score=42.83 TRINITY_DN10882_c0_g2_i1:134-811(+)